jgi:hypothetical protein
LSPKPTRSTAQPPNPMSSSTLPPKTLETRLLSENSPTT